MQKESRAFLDELLNTPSPTGFETKIQKVVEKRMKKYAETIERDLHGNLIVGINTKAKRKVMLAGHCDQIGFIVRHITNDGYIYLSPLGGIDLGVTLGAQVTLYGKKETVHGVIGRKPIHMQVGEEREKVKLDIEKIYVDIGAKNKKEVEKILEIGDPVTYKLGTLELRNGLISGPGLDDKVGLYVAMETLRLASELKKLNVALYAVSTVQEEVGLRGAQTAAYGIHPEVGIAIDVFHATDNPAHDAQKASPFILGKGPAIFRGPNANPIVADMLHDAAKKAKVKTQTLPSTRPLGNDANVIQVTRAGVAAGSIGIANRYMHTQVEVCALQDLDDAAKLLTSFVSEIKPNTDFRPR